MTDQLSPVPEPHAELEALAREILGTDPQQPTEQQLKRIEDLIRAGNRFGPRYWIGVLSGATLGMARWTSLHAEKCWLSRHLANHFSSCSSAADEIATGRCGLSGGTKVTESVICKASVVIKLPSRVKC